MTCIVESTDGVPAQPDVYRQSPRIQKIVDEARAMLRGSGWSAINIHRLAARLDVRAPSLYRHISGKEELLQLLLTESLGNLDKRIHATIDEKCASASLLQTYRQTVLNDPHDYRLMSRTNFVNVTSLSSLDAWIRNVFIKVAGDESKGLAAWAFAHGLMTAELIQGGSPVLKPSTEAGAADSLAAAGAIRDASAETFF